MTPKTRILMSALLIASVVLIAGAMGADRNTTTKSTATATKLSPVGSREDVMMSRNAWDNFQALLYDYDVYSSDPVYSAFWVRYVYFDGYEDVGPFLTEAAALDRLSQAPADINGADFACVVVHDTELDFRFYATFDSYADAVLGAYPLVLDGKVIDIRRRSDIVWEIDDAVLWGR